MPNAAIQQLGAQTTLLVSELTFYRIENGEKVVIATMVLPEPISVTATYDQISADGTNGWVADFGNSLEEALQTQGYKFVGGEGDDIFSPDSMILPFTGDNIIRGKGGDDHLTGSLGNDRLSGGTGDDYLFDPDGVNRLLGGSGNDYIELGDGSDGSKARGGPGDDTLVSGAGSDILVGGSGNDRIFGGGGDDRIRGGSGDDFIYGGRGSDRMSGGAGADQFVFYAEDQGHDVIRDFEDGIDTIVMHDLASYDDLNITQHGNHSLISWGVDGSYILVRDIDAEMLNADDFLFL